MYKRQALDFDGDETTIVWGDSGSSDACRTLELEAGEYNYPLTATDAYGASHTDNSLDIVILPEPNEDPTVIADADLSLTVAHDSDPLTTTVDTQVCAAGSDADGDAFTYLWSTGSTDACIDLTLEAGDYSYSVTVTDSYGATASDGMNISVAPEPNQDPYISISDQEYTVAHDADPNTTTAPVEICADSGDPDGDPVTYSWSSGGSRNGTNLPEHLEGLSEAELAHYYEKQDQAHEDLQ